MVRRLRLAAFTIDIVICFVLSWIVLKIVVERVIQYGYIHALLRSATLIPYIHHILWFIMLLLFTLKSPGKMLAGIRIVGEGGCMFGKCDNVVREAVKMAWLYPVLLFGYGHLIVDEDIEQYLLSVGVSIVYSPIAIIFPIVCFLWFLKGGAAIHDRIVCTAVIEDRRTSLIGLYGLFGMIVCVVGYTWFIGTIERSVPPGFPFSYVQTESVDNPNPIETLSFKAVYSRTVWVYTVIVVVLSFVLHRHYRTRRNVSHVREVIPYRE
ncbi:MAG: RDD family protein [Candidatus Omnitrophica bacterium]|nr:RDD family protein [Candidatus Omnitrophota bacterium]